MSSADFDSLSRNSRCPLLASCIERFFFSKYLDPPTLPTVGVAAFGTVAFCETDSSPNNVKELKAKLAYETADRSVVQSSSALFKARGASTRYCVLNTIMFNWCNIYV